MQMGVALEEDLLRLFALETRRIERHIVPAPQRCPRVVGPPPALLVQWVSRQPSALDCHLARAQRQIWIRRQHPVVL